VAEGLTTSKKAWFVRHWKWKRALTNSYCMNWWQFLTQFCEPIYCTPRITASKYQWKIQK